MRRHRSAILALVTAAMVGSVASPAAATDKIRNGQWHLVALNIAEAHRLSPGLGDGIKIGIMDSGVEGTHPDLAGNVLPGLALWGQDPKAWTDTDGHGTGMAGVAVAHGHGNGDGALGIAPKAKVVPVRLLGSDEIRAQHLANEHATAPEDFARAITWLVDQGVRIISLSVMVYTDDVVQNAIKAAKARGVLVIMGAGNKTHGQWTNNSTMNANITVGASDRNGQLDPVTVDPGPFTPITLLAPGREIVSTNRAGKYRIGTGTSDSAPITAGTAALIWSKYPTLTADDVVWRILSTAHDVGNPGVDRETGWGVIDPVASLATNVPASPASAASAQPGVAATCADPRMVPPACSKVSTPSDSSSAAGPAGTPAVLITVVAASVALALASGVGAALWYRRRRAEWMSEGDRRGDEPDPTEVPGLDARR